MSASTGNIAKSWLNDKNRQQFEGVEFRPIARQMASKYLTVGDDGVLNLYRGMSTEAIKGKCNLILDHIRTIWCNSNQELYDYVLNWKARMYQFPGERAHTALALLSVPGAGKGLITDIHDNAFGEHGYTFTNGKSLTGNFNMHLGTSVFINANEATYGGDKKEVGVLKGIITDETLTLEPKGVDAFQVNNCIHLIICTNNDWSIGQDIGDRRIVSLDVSDARVGDKAYFDALRNEINNGGAEAFIYYLMHRDISQFRPQNMPSYVSAMERENKLRSASTAIQWFASIVDDGEIPHPAASSSSLVDANWTAQAELAKHVIYAVYVKWCKDINLRPEHTTTFGKKLADLGVTSGRRKINGRRENVYVFPPHSDCEIALEDLLTK